MSKLPSDINHFFNVFLDRTDSLKKQMSPQAQAEFSEEIDLLRVSILNRISEEIR